MTGQRLRHFWAPIGPRPGGGSGRPWPLGQSRHSRQISVRNFSPSRLDASSARPPIAPITSSGALANRWLAWSSSVAHCVMPEAEAPVAATTATTTARALSGRRPVMAAPDPSHGHATVGCGPVSWLRCGKGAPFGAVLSSPPHLSLGVTLLRAGVGRNCGSVGMATGRVFTCRPKLQRMREPMPARAPKNRAARHVVAALQLSSVLRSASPRVQRSGRPAPLPAAACSP
jgi:hypothetical protein